MKLIRSITAVLLTASLMAPALSLAAQQKELANPSAKMSVAQPININTADEQALEQVIGLGPSKAKAIVAFRRKNGNFKSVNDLTEVPGIGEKLLAKIKSQLTS